MKMSFISSFINVVILLTYQNPVKGSCPYTQSSYDDYILSISNAYMHPISYDTYRTDCHRFVSQPPTIPDTVMDHALHLSISRTDRYIALDVAAPGDILSTSKQYNDMDRNNYFFESVTRNVQQTTCTSKKTTTIDLPTVNVENFKSYMKKNVTKVACEAGHVKHPKCSSGYSYRTFDGTCNNLKRPLEGRPLHCMLRLLPPDYKDGISEFRTSADGSALPNARILSTHLLGDVDAR